MSRNPAVIIYLLLMVAVIVTVDVLFFRQKFWERLMSNIGIVLIFLSFYLAYIKRR